jgi:dolichol-phosphate mannosyltransferase
VRPTAPKSGGTLSILSRKVVDAFLTLRDAEREYVIALDWLGFKRGVVRYEHAERPSGRSAYNLRRLVRVALSGVIFRTSVFLRWIVVLGFVIALVGFALAIWTVEEYFRTRQPRGYTSLAVLLLLLVGFVIVSLGVLGLYVSRIFEQVKGRPLFVIAEEARARGGVAEPPAVVAPVAEASSLRLQAAESQADEER